MWIISRGYNPGDDFIAVITNTKYSHAVLLDHEKMTVLEAIAEGVVETPLDKYLRESHRFLLVNLITGQQKKVQPQYLKAEP